MFLFDDIAAGMAYCFLAHGAPAAAQSMPDAPFGANPLEANRFSGVKNELRN
jgi:hypothetical protein